MNRRAQAHRDLLIALESLTGRSQSAIAERYGISERTVRRAVKRAKQRGGAFPTGTSFGHLSEHWVQLAAAIEDLALVRTAATNPRTSVAAIRAQAALLIERWRILVSLGLVQAPTEGSTSRGARRGTPIAPTSGRD